MPDEKMRPLIAEKLGSLIKPNLKEPERGHLVAAVELVNRHNAGRPASEHITTYAQLEAHLVGHDYDQREEFGPIAKTLKKLLQGQEPAGKNRRNLKFVEQRFARRVRDRLIRRRRIVP